jgi:hypothetical protein
VLANKPEGASQASRGLVGNHALWQKVGSEATRDSVHLA